MTEKGKAMIRQFEGCSLVAYKCPAGVWTIGYGSTFYADGTPVKEGDKIDQATANRLFDIVLEKFEKQVRLIINDLILPQEAVDALISFSYNVGTTAFAKSTLLKRIKENKLNFDAIETEWMKWVYAGGKKLDGLVRRRKEEYQMYFNAVINQYKPAEAYNLGKYGKIKR